jgi:orotidine-5'-phosphate decarboxylase
MKKPFLWIALDDPETSPGLIRRLAEAKGEFGFKLNLDHFLAFGITAGLSYIKKYSLDRPLFADLKMWNGSRTMSQTVAELVAAGVRYVNIYALADTMLPKVIEKTQGSETKVLGLTVLTHYNDLYCLRHYRRSLMETVRHLAETAINQGCHGVILPGTTLWGVSDMNVIKLVPGVRPTWFKDDRHEEEVEPSKAGADGATDIVCGSPIFKSGDPVEALNRLLSEL